MSTRCPCATYGGAQPRRVSQSSSRSGPGDVDDKREPDPGEQHKDRFEREAARMVRARHPGYGTGMCRSIRNLRRPEGAATTGEAEAAALQYVRKISGYRAPAARNQAAFEAAVAEVAEATERLLQAIGTPVEDGPDPWADPPTAG